jgi:hypothetical protein
MSDVKSAACKRPMRVGITLLGCFFSVYGLFELYKISENIVFYFVQGPVFGSKTIAAPLDFQNLFNLCYLMAFVIVGYGLIRHKLWSRFGAMILSAIYIFLLISNIVQQWGGAISHQEFLPYMAIIFIPFSIIIYLSRSRVKDYLTD